MAHSHSHADSHLPKDNNARRLLSPLSSLPDLCSLRWWADTLRLSGVVGGCGTYAHRRGGPSLCAAGGSIFPSSPDCSPHFWLAKTHHTGGLCECHCVGGHYLLIVWEAIERFYTPRPVAGNLMMVIAVAGLLANLFAFWILHRGSDEKT